MASPLAGSLAATIGAAFNSLFLDATLTRDVPGTIVDPADPPVPTTTDYTCKAIREMYGVGYRSAGIVNANDVKIIILQTSLAVTPQSGDRITITGMGGPWTIVPNGSGQPAVGADPANATWEIRAAT
jgi:hypothetical protein